MVDGGSAADWIAAVGTAGALLWGVYIYRGSQKSAEREQADQVFFNVGVPEKDMSAVDLSVFNASSQRITNPFFLKVSSKSLKWRVGIHKPLGAQFIGYPEWRQKRDEVIQSMPEHSRPAPVAIEKPRTFWPNYRGSTRFRGRSVSDYRDDSAVVFKDVRGRFWIRHFMLEQPIRLTRAQAEHLLPDPDLS
ncbi:hypothetical protein [Rathayibacter sp. AY1D9]|uniref:hypothetical protein n=1 Tax=Rathayibacter sp. AY1D9 TaxID=2080548 RepID=UPI0011B00B20|nr:hypothetical protein [Rathayibacter sp. AY1D9]